MGFKGKSGGGFWNNVDGEFVGYKFETFDSKAGDTFVSFVPEILVDGQEDATSRGLLLGGADRYTVSDDGLSVSAAEGDVTSYGANSPAGHWLDSLVTAGEALGIEALLPDLDAGEPINLEALIGSRFRLGTITDVKGTKDKGQEVGKDGVKRDRKFNVITDVYSLPGKKAAKGAKPAAGKVTKGAKDAKANTDARDKADAIVVALITAAQAADKKNKTGEIPVSKFKMAALKSLAKDADKDAVIKLLGDEAYRVDAAEREVFSYDAEGETVATA